MNNDKYLWELQRTLSAEMTKYLMTHPDLDAKIPNNAQIVFHLKGHAEFNAWSEEVGCGQREAGQPVVIIEVDDLASSRLINPHVEALLR